MKTRATFLFASALFLVLGLAIRGDSLAQEPFFKGKQIRIVVGLSSGGGYDRAARLIAKHMGKYIPGNPDILVQNMPGAGSVTAANYVWGVAKPDGLALLAPHNNVYLSQLSGQKEVQFDLPKFHWIGALEIDDMLLFARADAPFKSMADIVGAKEAPKCGSTGIGSSDYVVSKILDIGLAVLAAAVIFIAGAMYLRGIDIRSKQYSLIVLYRNVNGLKDGDVVTVAGFSVGHVESMSMAGRRIAVNLSIQTKVHLPRDSEAILKSETIMGGKFIEISPGADSLLLQDGDSLGGLYEADLSELTATLAPISSNVLGILENVNSTFDEPTRKRIQEIVADMARSAARLEEVIRTEGSRVCPGSSRCRPPRR